MMGGAPISWSSKRQASVSQSSCESEYYALSEAGKEGVLLCLLLQELGYISAAPTVIWADNQGAIAWAENPEFHKSTKHIDTKFHWVREVIERGVLLLEFLPTRFMAADGLTKPLPPKQFQRFLAMISMASWYGGAGMEELVWRSGKGVKEGHRPSLKESVSE